MHEFNFKPVQKQKFPMFVNGSGRQTVGHGPFVGRLALFIGPRVIKGVRKGGWGVWG